MSFVRRGFEAMTAAAVLVAGTEVVPCLASQTHFKFNFLSPNSELASSSEPSRRVNFVLTGRTCSTSETAELLEDNFSKGCLFIDSNKNKNTHYGNDDKEKGKSTEALNSSKKNSPYGLGERDDGRAHYC